MTRNSRKYTRNATFTAQDCPSFCVRWAFNTRFIILL